MPSIDRRGLIAGLASTVSLAGCLDGEDRTETGNTTPTDSATPTGQFSLTPVDPVDVEGLLTVLSENLRAWLRSAASDDTTIREVAGSYVYPATQSYDQIPPLLAFDRVDIADPDGDAGGVYEIDAEGGVRYDLLVGAEAVSLPDDAEVTPVAELTGDRRELALAAVGAASDQDRRVYPETELGSWVRNSFFGEYYRHDDTVYRGREVQQTDAAFSSTQIWYVISASSTDAEAAVTLVLEEGDPVVRETIDDLRREHETIEPIARRVEGEPAIAARTVADERPLFLTHDAVFRAEFEA
ncbi:MAG: hypothetical protein ACOCSD_07995 [Halolamina sp.]